MSSTKEQKISASRASALKSVIHQMNEIVDTIAWATTFPGLSEEKKIEFGNKQVELTCELIQELLTVVGIPMPEAEYNEGVTQAKLKMLESMKYAQERQDEMTKRMYNETVAAAIRNN